MTPRYVRREAWLAGMPGVDPAGRPYSQWRPQSTAQPLNAPGADRVRGTAIHWPGSGVGSATYAFAERDPIAYVRSIHYNHRNRKPSGFDLGYGFVVVPNGDVYEGRAWYRQAAHGGDTDPGDENEQYLAIQLPVDNLRPHPLPSQAQIESVRWLIGEQRRRYPGANEISDHQTVDGPGNTSCPGPVLHAMAFNGTFEPTQGDDDLTDEQAAQLNAISLRVAQLQTELVGGNVKANSATAAAQATGAHGQATAVNTELDQVRAAVALCATKAELKAMEDRIVAAIGGMGGGEGLTKLALTLTGTGTPTA